MVNSFSLSENATDPREIVDAIMIPNHMPPRDPRWERRIVALCEALAARNRIVGKLDKTKDGVVIYNGMTVYPRSLGYVWSATVCVRATNCGTPSLGLAGPLPDDNIDPTQCYSTYEAADDAGKQAKVERLQAIGVAEQFVEAAEDTGKGIDDA